MTNIYNNGFLNSRKNNLKRLKKMNIGIPLCLMMLGFTGLMMLYSISGGEINEIVRSHFYRLIIGFLFFLFFSFISMKVLRIISFPIYFFLLLMLCYLYFYDISSVSRWISIADISFQPSEFLKFVLILILSSYYSFIGLNQSKKLRFNLTPIILILIPSFLILNQPDLGTAILIIITGFSAVFFLVSG